MLTVLHVADQDEVQVMLRDRFADYFERREGAIPWQMNKL